MKEDEDIKVVIEYTDEKPITNSVMNMFVEKFFEWKKQKQLEEEKSNENNKL